MAFEYKPVFAEHAALKAEVLPPGQAQAVARGYGQAEIGALLARVQASAPEMQTQILNRVTEQGLSDPQAIAGFLDAHFRAADAAVAAQPVTIEQAGPSAPHPFAGLAVPAMPKLAVADLGGNTAALAGGAAQSAAVPQAGGQGQGGGRAA